MGRTHSLPAPVVTLLAGLLAAPAAGQPAPATTPSDASLARIRQELAVERDTVAQALAGLEFRDPTLVLETTPDARRLGALAFVGGVRVPTAPPPGGAVPLGGPTHQGMLHQMTPPEVRQMASADALGIGTASAFALAPRLVSTVLGWIRGAPTAIPPSLSRAEETTVLTTVRAGTEILHAAIDQRGRTMELALVVPDGTPAPRARALGRRLVWLVKATAAAEEAPGPAAVRPGPGRFDYIVHVSTPTGGVLATGGKTTADPDIAW